MIGWSQDISFDEIIFSNGDTIYGDVIEVGVNEIRYKHTGESTNNIIKTRKVAKIIYASGREAIFKGDKILKKRIEKDMEGKKWKLKIGGNSILPFKKTFERTEGFEGADVSAKLGVNCQISYMYEWNSLISYIPSVSYYLITLKKIDNIGPFTSTLNSKHQYVSLAQNIQYKVNEKVSASMGFSIDKPFKIKEKGESVFYVPPLGDPAIPNDISITINDMYNTDLGFYISLPISVNYLIHENKHYNFSVYTDINIPLYYSKNDDVESSLINSDTWPQLSKQENLLYNRNIAIGLLISF